MMGASGPNFVNSMTMQYSYLNYHNFYMNTAVQITATVRLNTNKNIL